MKKISITLLVVLVTIFILVWLRPSKRRVIDEVPNPIVVGTSADFPPMSFIKDSEIVGFDIDIIHEVAKRLGKEIVLKNMPFDVLLPQLQLGSLHVVAAGLTATDERAKQLNFSQPYLVNDPLVIVTLKTKPAITDIKDIKGKEVLVNQGYTADAYISKIDGVRVTRLGSLSDALLALTHNRGEVFVTALSTLKPVIEQYGPDAFHIFVIPETGENTALGITKSYAKLAQEIDHVLQTMQKDGTIELLKQKWHLT